MKNRAATASSTITTKIDCTTLEVVWAPTDSALPLTLKPSRQPMAAIRKAKNGAFTMPTRKCFTPMSDCSSERTIAGEISRVSAHTTPPPTIPESIARNVSIGSDTSRASTRGKTNSSIGSRPSDCTAHGLRSPLRWGLGVGDSPAHLHEEQGGDRIEHDHHKDRLHHAGGGMGADRLGTAADLEALQATYGGDQEGEERRFHHAHQEMLHTNVRLQQREKHRR